MNISRSGIGSMSGRSIIWSSPPSGPRTAIETELILRYLDFHEIAGRQRHFEGMVVALSVLSTVLRRRGCRSASAGWTCAESCRGALSMGARMMRQRNPASRDHGARTRK